MKKELEPIMVHDPFSGRDIDIAPLLYTIHDTFEGFDGAAEDLCRIIEDFSSSVSIDDSILLSEFHNHIYELSTLRRCFVRVHNPKYPYSWLSGTSLPV